MCAHFTADAEAILTCTIQKDDLKSILIPRWCYLLQ